MLATGLLWSWCSTLASCSRGGPQDALGSRDVWPRGRSPTWKQHRLLPPGPPSHPGPACGRPWGPGGVPYRSAAAPRPPAGRTALVPRQVARRGGLLPGALELARPGVAAWPEHRHGHPVPWPHAPLSPAPEVEYTGGGPRCRPAPCGSWCGPPIPSSAAPTRGGTVLRVWCAQRGPAQSRAPPIAVPCSAAGAMTTGREQRRRASITWVALPLPLVFLAAFSPALCPQSSHR